MVIININLTWMQTRLLETSYSFALHTSRTHPYTRILELSAQPAHCHHTHTYIHIQFLSRKSRRRLTKKFNLISRDIAFWPLFDLLLVESEPPPRHFLGESHESLSKVSQESLFEGSLKSHPEGSLKSHIKVS